MCRIFRVFELVGPNLNDAFARVEDADRVAAGGADMLDDLREFPLHEFFG